MPPSFHSPSPHSPPSHHPYVSQPENLILPDGPVDTDTAELLEDFVHSQDQEIDVDADYHTRREYHRNFPWYKVPTPWWLLTIVPFTAIAMSATIAPRIESNHNRLFDMPRALSEHPLTPQPKSSNIVAVSLPDIQYDTTVLDKPTCASDPVVQAAVAKLSAVITTSMGILSCLTTGWWGSFSDRQGRTRLLSISVIGVLYTDLNFIFVSRNFQHLPGGYWCLVLGPLLDGLLGGLSASTAAMHAYIADTTTEGSRSRNLSLSLGLLFTGMAIGPAFGSFLIRVTGSLLSVFYAAAIIHFIYALVIWCFIPESLLKSQMQQSKMKYDEEIQLLARRSEVNPAIGVLVVARKAFIFLRPLNVFLPSAPVGRRGNPLKKGRRDWNLTLVAVVYGLAVSIMGSYIYKFQFAAAKFGWDSETLGYFITLVGGARALFLALILPCLIKLLKPKPTRPSNNNESEPLMDRAPGVIKREPHASSFDLGIARASLLMDVISYTSMVIAPTALVFTVSNTFSAMGAGLSPAIQSVALALYRRRGGTESGRLFGALGVVQALSSQIFGPAVYGLVYVNTVATFPKAIFIMSMVSAMISFAMLTLVRLPKGSRLREMLGELGSQDDEEVGAGVRTVSENSTNVIKGPESSSSRGLFTK